MNYKIAKTMLILCIVYLLSFYILKFAFPNILLQAITSPTILKLGEFINSWKGYEYIVMCLGSIITFYLFCCASSGRFRFIWYEYLIIVLGAILNNIIVYNLPEIYTHTTISIMFILALVVKGKLFYSVISLTIHGYLSLFLTSIRGFNSIIVQISEIGVLSGLILSLEAYLWLILLAIIFNIKERKK